MAETKQRHWICRGSLSEKVLDHLTTHGGWYTTAALLELSESKSDWLAHPVRRTLFRLKTKGLIESRPTGPRTRGQPQNEWRATDRAWEYL